VGVGFVVRQSKSMTAKAINFGCQSFVIDVICYGLLEGGKKLTYFTAKSW